MSERALEPCRHPPRIRRLCSNRRNGGRRMAQVCLLPVLATRRHGQETSLTTTTGRRAVRPSASRLRPSRARQSMPPAARPRAHAHRRNACQKPDVAAWSVVEPHGTGSWYPFHVRQATSPHPGDPPPCLLCLSMQTTVVCVGACVPAFVRVHAYARV
jgi:hypothetical protein